MDYITSKVADYAVATPDFYSAENWSSGAKAYTPHPALVAISDDLRDNVIGLPQAAGRAMEAHDQLQGKADEMTIARLRCVAKRSLRAIA